jgi:hypothetical protein
MSCATSTSIECVPPDPGDTEQDRAVSVFHEVVRQNVDPTRALGE